MLNAEREEKIKAYILEKRYASLSELSEVFGVSVPTVRRCVKRLAADGVIDIVRGGAMYLDNQRMVEQPYEIKRKLNLDEKKRIAEEASRQIVDSDCVFLDSSSTVFEMLPHIQELNNLKVATNDVVIATVLSGVPNVSVLVTGGSLRKGYNTLMGSFAETLLSQIHVDCAFIGVDAISRDGNFMITNSEEVGIKRAAFYGAAKRIVLCDHSKFEKSAFISLWNHEKIDLIITGRELDDNVFEYYLKLGLKIVRV